MSNEHELDIDQQIDVKATPEAVFEGLIHRLTEANMRPDGVPMPMKMELRPGGRWYRDLGADSGHFWAVVQSYKPGELLEFYGPLFMSYPVSNNVMFRLAESEGGTRLTLRHRAFGLIDPAHREGVAKGWANYLRMVKEDCEKGAPVAAH